MPLTVFDIKGVPGTRRERIQVAVVAGGRHSTGPHEAWIAADPFNGGFRVLITDPTVLTVNTVITDWSFQAVAVGPELLEWPHGSA